MNGNYRHGYMVEKQHFTQMTKTAKQNPSQKILFSLCENIVELYFTVKLKRSTVILCFCLKFRGNTLLWVTTIALYDPFSISIYSDQLATVFKWVMVPGTKIVPA